MPETTLLLNAVQSFSRGAPANGAKRVGAVANLRCKVARAGFRGMTTNRPTPAQSAGASRAVFGTAMASRPRLSIADGIERARQSGVPWEARQVRRVVCPAALLNRDSKITDRTVGQPGGRGGADGVARNSAIERQLEKEIATCIGQTYVKRVLRQGDHGCPGPVMSAEAFLCLIKSTNEIMEDLHRRFPKLRDCPPPNLAQTDIWRMSGHVFGAYFPSTRTMCFANPLQHDLDRIWGESRARGLLSPHARGMPGLVAHELAHHVTLGQGDNVGDWMPGLISTLKNQGIVPARTNIRAHDPDSTEFCDEAGPAIESMGFGIGAADSPAEFVSEALAWRMAPGYAESNEIPRLPGFIEDWLHECFPFTRDGAVPPPEAPHRAHDV